MKKTALTLAATIFMIVVVGVEFVKIVEANPYSFFWTWVDPIPGTIPPKITITNPKNYTTYSSGDLNFTVHVAKPETPTQYGTESYILSVHYYLDGKPHRVFNNYFEPVPEVDNATVLHDLNDGNHTLVVQVEGGVEPEPYEVFFIDSNSTVFFTINNTASSSIPSLTQGYGLKLPSPQQTAILIGALAVSCIVLIAFYFKKRQRGKSP
jgi:hypothetical protein